MTTPDIGDSRKSGEPSDAELLALNAGERFFSESPTKYPEAGHGTQYHAGAPGVVGFARAILARFGTRPAAEPSQSGSAGEAEEGGPLVEGWQLSVAHGHSGYGVYAHMEEYPEEGAILLLALAFRSTAAQGPFPPADDWDECHPAPTPAGSAVAEVEIHDGSLKAWIEHLPLPDGRHKLYAAPTPAEPADDLPSMWDRSDLEGGQTDCAPAEPAKTEARPYAELPTREQAIKVAEELEAESDRLTRYGGSGDSLLAEAARIITALSTPPTPEAEPAQQDTKPPCSICGDWLCDAPPAEKQAAPSGEGS